MIDQFQTNQNSISEDSSKYYIPVSIVIAAIIVAGAIIYGQGKKVDLEKTKAQIGQLPVQSTGKTEVSSDDDPFMGPKNAKVSVIEFGDFQCPFCKRFFDQTMDTIKRNFVMTNKVKFVYRDFAFLGEESLFAAEAAQCAAEQEKFWPYHDLLWTKQTGENIGNFTKENLLSYAKEIGIDADKFKSCQDSRKYQQEVAKDIEDARKAGVDGTPTVFINGIKVDGAQPYTIYEQIIQEELKN